MFYGVPVGWAIWYMISSSLKIDPNIHSKSLWKPFIELAHVESIFRHFGARFWPILGSKIGQKRDQKWFISEPVPKTSQIFCSLRLDTVCRRRSSRPDVQLRRSSHRRRFWLPMWPGCGPKLDLKSAKNRSQNKWCFRSTFGPDYWSVCCNSVLGTF